MFHRYEAQYKCIMPAQLIIHLSRRFLLAVAARNLGERLAHMPYGPV